MPRSIVVVVIVNVVVVIIVVVVCAFRPRLLLHVFSVLVGLLLILFVGLECRAWGLELSICVELSIGGLIGFSRAIIIHIE